MEEELCIIQMEILNMKEIGLKINMMDMEKKFMSLVIIMKGILKMVSGMEKEHYIFKMEKLYMKVIGSMIKWLVDTIAISFQIY